jgi:two-component system cell cycle response regulator
MSNDKKGHVLIVEDTLTQFLMMQHLLESNGYTVANAKHGLKALEYLQTTLPDIILSDINMPELDGYELCMRLKDDPRTARIPFVLLSSFHDPHEIVNVVNSKADNFMLKRFDETYFIERLDTILKGATSAQSDPETFLLTGAEKCKIKGSAQQVTNMLISAFKTVVHLQSLVKDE